MRYKYSRLSGLPVPYTLMRSCERPKSDLMTAGRLQFHRETEDAKVKVNERPDHVKSGV